MQNAEYWTKFKSDILLSAAKTTKNFLFYFPFMPYILPRKTVVEANFQPRLDYFAKLDLVGNTVLGLMKVSDWSKSQFSVDVQDRKNHERVQIEYQRVFAEFDSSVERQKDAIDRAVILLESCISGLGVKELLSVGIRQWFAIERGSANESKLIAKLLKIYFNESLLELAELSSMKVKDIAITLELEDKVDPKRKGRLILGAMSKSQWTRYTAYSTNGSHIDLRGVESIVASLPNDFVFVDVDMRLAVVDELTPLPVEKLREWSDFVSGMQRKIPLRIIDDI